LTRNLIACTTVLDELEGPDGREKIAAREIVGGIIARAKRGDMSARRTMCALWIVHVLRRRAHERARVAGCTAGAFTSDGRRRPVWNGRVFITGVIGSVRKARIPRGYLDVASSQVAALGEAEKRFLDFLVDVALEEMVGVRAKGKE